MFGPNEDQKDSETSSFPPIFQNSFPSRFLEISGFPINFSEYLFYLLLSEIHQPIFVRKVITHANSCAASFIAEFSSVCQAIEILAGYQCQKVNTGKLVISYLN